jgi:hypothetical protein
VVSLDETQGMHRQVAVRSAMTITQVQACGLQWKSRHLRPNLLTKSAGVSGVPSRLRLVPAGELGQLDRRA